MAKQFDIWNKKKQLIDKKKNIKHFKERDILFLHLGENVGFEQNGKGEEFLRPVLVIKKFSAQTFLGVPLTSQSKEGYFYYSFEVHRQISTAILSQVKLFDARRIKYFYARLGRKEFGNIKEKLIEIIQ